MATESLHRFERIVLPHLDDAYTLARYLMRDDQDAQDVVHDAVLRALRHFDGYRGGDARAWLLAIVRNCASTWHRKDSSRPTLTLSGPAAPEIVDDLETDAPAIRQSERERIQRALDSLSPEFREVIVLREVQDLSYQEISTVVGAPIGTVMSRLSRARKQLAALLGVETKEAS